MTRLFSLALVLIALAAALPVPAWAAIDAAGATELKALLEKGLAERQKRWKTQMPDVELEAQGAFTVTPKENYYAVVSPQFILKPTVPADAAAPTRSFDGLSLGTISMNVMPNGNKEWKATIALPTPLRLVDFKGKGDVSLTLGPQKIAMIFNSDLAIVRMMDLSISDIRLTGKGMNSDNKEVPFPSLTIGSLIGKTNYKEEKPGLWSGPSQFVIKDFKVDIRVPGEEGYFSFSELAFNSMTKDWDATTNRKIQEKLTELEEAGLNSENLSGPAMSALWEIFTQYGPVIDTFTSDFVVKDIQVSTTGKDAINGKIKSLGYGLDVSDLRKEKAAGAIRFKLEDFSSNQSLIPPETAKYIPSQINYDLRFTNLPFKQILAEFGKLAEQGAAMKGSASGPGGGDAQMMAMQAMMTMPALLGQAGTTVSVKDTYFTAPDYKFALDGDFTANPQAIYVMVGKLKALFTGLDELVASLQARSQQPGVAETERAGISQMLQGLAMMQMMGQQGTDPSGKPARIYDFELDAQGAVKLNGADFKNMMGGMGGGAGAPPSVPH